jgi:urease accessory protein
MTMRMAMTIMTMIIMTTAIMTTAITAMTTIMITLMRMIITTTAITTTSTAIVTTTAIITIMADTASVAPDKAGTDGREAASLPASAALFRLMTWLSPAFPVGAFSYSSGLEWAVEAGDIRDAATLQDWLTSMLAAGSGFCDAVFLAHAHRAAADGNDPALVELSELAAAFVPSRERQLETLAQGRAFIDIASRVWSCAVLERFRQIWQGPVAYPVAVGVLGAGHRVARDLVLHGFLHAQVANWISAGVRLIPLGQTDGQRVLAALEPIIAETAHRAAQGSFDDLGSASFRIDIASMRHETQYTRLFRS